MVPEAKHSNGRTLVVLLLLGGLGMVLPHSVAGAATEDAGGGEKQREATAPAEHGDKCAGCQAHDIWKRFVAHLRQTGREDLIPSPAWEPLVDPEDEEGQAEGAGKEKPAEIPMPDLASGDPIRGVLFRVSKELVGIDALFQEAEGKPLSGPDREKALGLAGKLREADDPYLKAYGDFYAARLTLEAGDAKSALGPLEKLVSSCYFLPRRDARRCLVDVYKALGDETLAVLELRFFMLEPPWDPMDITWAEEELRKIRENEHPGPLHDSEESMRDVSVLIAGLDVGGTTQTKERRVEDILYKVAKLLEELGGT